MIAPLWRAWSSAARFNASPTPCPRAFPSTTTSSIQARTPVGIRNMANVNEPTITPSRRAMNKVDASDDTKSCRASRPGGGLDDDNWGINTSKAATNSSSTCVQMSTVTPTVASLGNPPSTVAP